ncbi:MAG TPA: ATP-binding protein [Vicinamibacteria bacterium]|nr:ATP-binding protein [Vicinamibacteria bacterium]
MLTGLLGRARARWARVLGRAFAYWAVAAALVCVTLATHQWAEERELRDATEAASIPRIELAQRAVLTALSAARADLHLLASMGVVGDFLRGADPVRRAALARDLFGFMATRDWCQRVVVSAGSARVAAERQPGAPACDTLGGVAAAFPSSEALLAVVRVSGSVRLCLGLPLGTGLDGTQAVLMAEADPLALFPDLHLLGPGGGGVYLRDAQGQWLATPAPQTRRLELRPFALRSWNGPAAGTWHIAYAPDERGQRQAASSRRRSTSVSALLLLASAAGAIALARAAEARRRAEDAVRQQLELFQRVSDNVPTPIYLKDVGGRYLGCNVAFETLVGRSREAILGRDVRALLPQGTTRLHEQADRDVLCDGGSLQYEAQVATHDGRVRDLLISKALVRDEEGRVAGLTAALQDITDRKAAERELRRSLEALRAAKEAAEAGTRAKSEFLAMMSHEIRTPLHAVLGGTALLAEGPLDADQREQVTMIGTAGRALLDLIDDLLDFSRIEAGRLDLDRIAFDVRRLCEDTLTLVAGRAKDKGLELGCVIDDGVPRCVTGDPGRLRQVLLNLLANAVEFTDRGWIRARVELARRERTGVVLRLRVQDSGAGIPAELMPHLFEPFAHAEASSARQGAGAGLGLALTRRLVELMGGVIEASSTPGRGSEITCTLRLGEAAIGDEVEAPGSALQKLGDRPCHVLLVEDNRVNQHVTSALLARLDCRVDIASDGQEALEALGRRRYDVVFMDCRMPGMSGYDASREIRRREGSGPQLPIVALTANALRGDRERCLAAGMTDYLAKPVDLVSLGRVLGRYVAQDATKPTVVTAPATTLVDPQALANLKMLERDGPGFLSTIVREFDEGARQRLGDMQLAARVGDGEGLHGAAHSLKGSAGIFGARGIADLCRRIEQIASERCVAEASPLIGQLLHEHEALMAVLHEAAASAVPA